MSVINIEGYIDNPSKFDGFQQIFIGCIKAGVELPEFIKDYINKIDLVTYDENGDRKYAEPVSRFLELAKQGSLAGALDGVRRAKIIGHDNLLESKALYINSNDDRGVDLTLDLEKLSEVAKKTKFIRIKVN
jgi:hypothetical protein